MPDINARCQCLMPAEGKWGSLWLATVPPPLCRGRGASGALTEASAAFSCLACLCLSAASGLQAAEEANNVFHPLTYQGATDLDRVGSVAQRKSIEAQVSKGVEVQVGKGVGLRGAPAQP